MITIVSIKTKAVERLMSAKKGATVRGMQPHEAAKIRRMIAVLLASNHPNELRADHANWRVHEWPNVPGKWSLDVTGNYRLMFMFDPVTQTVTDLEYGDPH